MKGRTTIEKKIIINKVKVIGENDANNCKRFNKKDKLVKNKLNRKLTHQENTIIK